MSAAGPTLWEKKKLMNALFQEAEVATAHVRDACPCRQGNPRFLKKQEKRLVRPREQKASRQLGTDRVLTSRKKHRRAATAYRESTAIPVESAGKIEVCIYAGDTKRLLLGPLGGGRKLEGHVLQ